jgi:hypothetical protein
MGCTSIIIALSAAVIVVAILWRHQVAITKTMVDSRTSSQAYWRSELDRAHERNVRLEEEIQRLRKISLTPPAQKADTSTIKAKSAAQVRQITETVWGKQPESEVG